MAGEKDDKPQNPTGLSREAFEQEVAEEISQDLKKAPKEPETRSSGEQGPKGESRK